MAENGLVLDVSRLVGHTHSVLTQSARLPTRRRAFLFCFDSRKRENHNHVRFTKAQATARKAEGVE